MTHFAVQYIPKDPKSKDPVNTMHAIRRLVPDATEIAAVMRRGEMERLPYVKIRLANSILEALPGDWIAKAGNTLLVLPAELTKTGRLTSKVPDGYELFEFENTPESGTIETGDDSGGSTDDSNGQED